jgi:hypothetical protein
MSDLKIDTTGAAYEASLAMDRGQCHHLRWISGSGRHLSCRLLNGISARPHRHDLKDAEND